MTFETLPEGTEFVSYFTDLSTAIHVHVIHPASWSEKKAEATAEAALATRMGTRNHGMTLVGKGWTLGMDLAETRLIYSR